MSIESYSVSRGSRKGFALSAIRDNELAASSLGIDTGALGFAVISLGVSCEIERLIRYLVMPCIPTKPVP